MAEIKWTLQAANDFESIVRYIAADSPDYARLIALGIVKCVEQLALFPQSGRVIPEVGSPELRELIYGNYRIFYRCKPLSIHILAIHHSSRQFDAEPLKQ